MEKDSLGMNCFAIYNKKTCEYYVGNARLPFSKDITKAKLFKENTGSKIEKYMKSAHSYYDDLEIVPIQIKRLISYE